MTGRIDKPGKRSKLNQVKRSKAVLSVRLWVQIPELAGSCGCRFLSLQFTEVKAKLPVSQILAGTHRLQASHSIKPNMTDSTIAAANTRKAILALSGDWRMRSKTKNPTTKTLTKTMGK
jgi:hypothetical protein